MNHRIIHPTHSAAITGGSHAIRAIAFSLFLLVDSYAAIQSPPGLQPGDSYHLVFVTEGSRDPFDNDNPADSNIAIFNEFVQSEARREGALTEDYEIDWYVIGSTPTTAARVNALIESPVFLLDGTKVADGFADMWDSSIDAPINLDQFGNVSTSDVYTGTVYDGIPSASHLGYNSHSFWLGGSTSETNKNWIGNSLLWETPLPFYALSEKLIVPTGNIPEPASFFVWVALGSSACIVGRRRSRAIV